MNHQNNSIHLKIRVSLQTVARTAFVEKETVLQFVVVSQTILAHLQIVVLSVLLVQNVHRTNLVKINVA